MDGPLDFEIEDPLLTFPVSTSTRKNVIGLDDLIRDYFSEKGKESERKGKRAKRREHYDSSEDEDGKEAMVSKIIDDCYDLIRLPSNDET